MEQGALLMGICCFVVYDEPAAHDWGSNRSIQYESWSVFRPGERLTSLYCVPLVYQVGSHHLR